MFKKVDANISWNYIAGIKEWISAVKAFHENPDHPTFDLQVNYPLPRNMRVSIGVMNLGDRQPPFVENSGSDGYDNSTHDMLGRNYYVRLAKSF